MRARLFAGAAAAVAATLAIMAAPAYGAPDTPPPTSGSAASGGAPPAASTASVTLITGDVVSVTRTRDGRQLASVRPAPGSSGGVQTQTVGKSLYVIPDAAQPLLAAGRLDRRLFDVTTLIADGYTNDATDALPVIVSYQGSAKSRSARPAPRGAVKKLDLRSINATALRAPHHTMRRFWRSVAPTRGHAAPRTLADGIAKIWLDGRSRATDNVSNPQVGAPQVWKQGLDGDGTRVAVLDSGVDADHPDLEGQIVDAVSFVPGEDTTDHHGHGTHVASTIDGTGAASDGKYKGVAPGAKLLVGKVLGNDGFGQDSWIIAGMEWAASHANVVSMSLGDPSVTVADDPMAQAVDRLSESTGALFVIAAGNAYNAGTVSSPGTADDALTVGAVDSDDHRAAFSSMGPRGGDHGMKPDISAPGVHITAARSSDSPGSGAYVAMSGTSMATPHVAAAAAILSEKHPKWKAPALKNALMSSSTELPGTTPYQVGSGRLWIPDTVDDIRATGSDFFGFYPWPGTGVSPVSRTVTYTNSGDAALRLDLDVHAQGPDGAAGGLYRLSDKHVTVPAHGTATVTVTADADDAAGTGQFTGEVDATDADGDVLAHTAVALVKEHERYDLNIRAVGRTGKPAGGTVTLYRYGDQQVHTLTLDPDTGKARAQRLAPGIYNVTSWLPVRGRHGPDSTGVALVGNPHLVIGKHDASLVLDARKATPVTVRTPKRAEPDFRRMQYFHDSGIGGKYATFGATYRVPRAIDDMFAAPTGAVGGDRYEFAVRWRLSHPYLTVSATHGIGRLDPTYLTGSARLDGRVHLRVVSAGTGTPDEYSGVHAKGSAAVITRSDDVALADAVAAAEHAGAALLVVVNDRPGRYVPAVPATDLPVVSLTAAEGRPLVHTAAHKRVLLHGKAVEFSPYKYDLSKSYPGAIPARLAWRVRERDLARVHERFVGDRGDLAFETRYDCRDYQWPPCLGLADPQGLGRARTSYVSTEPGNEWYQTAVQASGWEQRYDRLTYRPGQRSTVDWFAPVTRPRLGSGYWGPYRQGDFLAVNVAPDGGPAVTGHDGTNQVVSRLYQNDTLVDTAKAQAVQTVVPHVDGTARYRFEQVTTDDSRRLSTETHSSWSFRSATPNGDKKALLPMLQLGYDVHTDLSGNARAGHRARIGLSAWQQPDAVGAGKRVTDATLEVSYDDGATWKHVRLHRTRHGWTGTVRYPRRGAHYVSLRASAADSAGNTVRQQVIRAYGLD